MALDFREVRIDFDPTKGRKQREPGTAIFRSRVIRANAALKGFSIGYTDDDHNIYKQEIDIDITRINNNTVSFFVDFFLRDSSGNIDDRYDGWVKVLVIADVE